VKKILTLCAVVLVLAAAYFVWRIVQPEHYGKAFAGAPAATIAQLSHKQVTGDVRVEGKIVRQCPVAGCWFYVDDGKGNQVRIELGKIVPKLPQKVGRTAVVEGRLILSDEEPTLAGAGVEFK
jgi:hypothetical protein